MLFRFCLYGFLKNQRYFEPFLMLVFLEQGLSFFLIGMLIACRDLTVNLLEIPSGAIADSFGRRRAMMVSFVAYIISFLILGTATHIGWNFLGMFFYGIGDTFRTGTHKAMIFEWLRLNNRSHERTRIYGVTRSWSQIGSAVSGLIAATFILISGNYRFVFFFAIVPYVANLINFAGYPAELDGDHAKARSLRESVGRLKQSFKKAFVKPQLRWLMVESMGWEGFFSAIKDYLQPVLQTLAIGMVAYFLGQQVAVAGIENGATAAGTEGWLNEARQTALLIGPVYGLLFLLSAWGSRSAHRVVNRFGGEQPASIRLWITNALVFVLIGLGAWFHVAWIVVLGLVGLHVLKNVWRPILISRFDSLADASEGATVLSIESQAQRLATMVMAPIIGWMIDRISRDDQAVEYWPIGLVGAVIAVGIVWASSIKPRVEPPARSNA